MAIFSFLANLKARKVADAASSLQNGSFNSLRWVGSCRAGVTLKFSLLKESAPAQEIGADDDNSNFVYVRLCGLR